MDSIFVVGEWEENGGFFSMEFYSTEEKANKALIELIEADPYCRYVVEEFGLDVEY